MSKAKLPSAESKTRRERVEYLRNHIDNAAVRQFVALYDSAVTWKEVVALEKREDELIPGCRELPLAVRYALSDARWEAEDRVRKAAKEADKARIAANKAAKAGKMAEREAEVRRFLSYPMLETAIAVVVEAFRPELLGSYRSYTVGRLERFITDGGRVVVPEPEWKGRGKSDPINRVTAQVYAENRAFVVPYQVKGVVRPDYREMIAREAARYAEDVLAGLRVKLAMKLGPVIDRKGGGEVRPVGTAQRHAIFLSFPDGSRFTVRSQIVNHVSKNRVFFTRQPMTFHDVVFADGSRMVTPSAGRMLQEFGIDDSE